MHLLRRAHAFEYRAPTGDDRLGTADIWTNAGATRAVVVLQGIPASDSARALSALHDSALPYLLRPDTRLLVLNLRPRAQGEKARATVLPLSA
ncbi:hypothetical protein GO986_11045 [Deinococcus sp. HMF7620]|uniref:Uncharacterized protein n=1 Tax=Deinococcus arboris TaxID=2682977 RepID=A0A7C9HYV4_9DEIO|nr:MULTISPECIES: hypothetical protein [Deinococcus]MBZ9750963.1 hypothetical protein [Deinococcus betulae]MVN87308.1 hypothetical protein [Deinococcus arboris]